MKTHRLDPSMTPMWAAVEWFLGRAGEGALDLSKTLVATPGARAGRVLITLLARACQDRGLAFWPPQTVTAGRLAETLVPAALPAGEVHRTLAWRVVLNGAPREALRAVLPNANDPARWAEELAQAAEELARGGLRCADVAGAELPPLEEPERWHAMAALQAGYEALLAQSGLADPSLHAIDTEASLGMGLDAVVLLGCVDMTNLARSLLRRATCEVHALVALDSGLHDDGVVDEAYWHNVEIDVDPGDVFVTGGPEEQGALAARAAADLDTSAIGTADESLAGAVRRAVGGHGLSVHVAWGVPAAASGPGQLLGDIGLLLRERSFAAMARVLRCPMVVASLAEHDQRFLQLPRALDDYEAAALPASAFGTLPEGHERAKRARRIVIHARRALAGAIKPLRGRARTLREWAPEIESALVALLEPAQQGLGPASIAAVEAIGQQLRTLAALPGPIDASRVPAHEAISLVLTQLAQRGTPGEPGGEDLDVLGWLELPLDPSPALVVMGAHHSALPGASTPGPLLTESLRRSLGLPGESRKLARDAASLSTLLRGTRRVRFVLGTVDTSAEPLLPSTLLLRGSGDGPARVLERVRSAFETPPAEPELDACQYRVGVLREAPAIDSMAVTSFRTYLESPYLFYLRHALKLREVEPPSVIARLEANTFGTLLHEALRRFALEPGTRNITDQSKIRQLMHAGLWEATEQLTGQERSATTLAQIDAAERRLAAYAAVEADRRLAGWRTIEVEWSPAEHPLLGDTGVLLRGAIDRIDWHERDRKLALLDYKTADTGRSPKQTHRRRDGSWIDLQLPLYEVLAQPVARVYELEQPPTLGYITLAGSEAKVLEACWEHDDVLDAQHCAADIARRVRTGVGAMADIGKPRYEGPHARLAGVGMLLDPEHVAPPAGGGS